MPFLSLSDYIVQRAACSPVSPATVTVDPGSHCAIVRANWPLAVPRLAAKRVTSRRTQPRVTSSSFSNEAALSPLRTATAHPYRHRRPASSALSTDLIDNTCSPSRCVVVKEYVGDLNTRHSRTGGSHFWLASAFPLLRVRNRRRFVLSKSVLVIVPSIDACLFQNSTNTSPSHEPERTYAAQPKIQAIFSLAPPLSDLPPLGYATRQPYLARILYSRRTVN
jgi:hypothetical protein